MFFFSGQRSVHWIAKSHGKCMFNFIGVCRSVFQDVCSILHLFYILVTTWYCQSNRSVVVCHCGLCLHFHDGWWCTSFHVTGHSLAIFCEVLCSGYYFFIKYIIADVFQFVACIFIFLVVCVKERSCKFNEIFIRLFYNFPITAGKVWLTPGYKKIQLCILLEDRFCSFHTGFLFFLLMC